MDILRFMIIKQLKAKPFQSETLDKLAEKMQASKILKNGELERYYKAPSLQRRSTVYNDRVFFDTEYYNMLSSIEITAVAAHEFSHIKNNHYFRRFARVMCPPLIIGLAIIGTLLANSELVNSTPFFHSLLGNLILITLFISPLSLLIVSVYINAKWLRQLETDCDLSAAKFVNGEAMISALNKLKKLESKEEKISDLPFAPKLYPTIEKRINDIRVAMNKTS